MSADNYFIPLLALVCAPCFALLGKTPIANRRQLGIRNGNKIACH